MPHSKLTPTERKVFDLVVRGRLNKQIAAELGITERTVKWHRHNIMPKLNVVSLAGLVSLAEQLGMIKPPEARESTSNRSSQRL